MSYILMWFQFLNLPWLTLEVFCQAERKLMRAEKALSKVEEFLKPAHTQADPESITDEERFMFRKLGLRMKAFLLLGTTMLQLLYLSCLFSFITNCLRDVNFILQVDEEFLMVL